MDLKPGDIFCTENPMWLGRAICTIQRFNSVDNQAAYSHTGIILGPNATTFEATWTNRRQGLFNAHGGKDILIARHQEMSIERFLDGWTQVAHLEGHVYAGHRLFLHLVPPLAKYLSTGGFAVCSELTAKFLCGARLLDYWSGVTPDYIADMVTRWKGWEVIYRGILHNKLSGDLTDPVVGGVT